MQNMLFCLLLLGFVSCEYEKYPAENYAIPQKYRDLIASFKSNDTIIFEDNSGNFITILVEKIDSSLDNKRGYFMNRREHKEISIHFRRLTNAQKAPDELHFISVSKHPDEDSTSFSISLIGFLSSNQYVPIKLMRDTIFTNETSFSNYFMFRPNGHEDLLQPNSIIELYMTKQDGIIALKYLNGKWWTKVKRQIINATQSRVRENWK
jgi:hypothetical protein